MDHFCIIDVLLAAINAVSVQASYIVNSSSGWSGQIPPPMSHLSNSFFWLLFVLARLQYSHNHFIFCCSKQTYCIRPKMQLAQHSVAAMMPFRGQENKKLDNEKIEFWYISNTIKSYMCLQPVAAFHIC